jgi:hypothetical protein
MVIGCTKKMTVEKSNILKNHGWLTGVTLSGSGELKKTWKGRNVIGAQKG